MSVIPKGHTLKKQSYFHELLIVRQILDDEKGKQKIV